MSKNKYVSLLGVFLILAGAGSKIAAAAGKSACDVLVKADVAFFLSGNRSSTRPRGRRFASGPMEARTGR